MAVKTYRVMAESTGGFIVEAENEAQAEGMVLDHMLKMGTPFLSGSVEYRESESPYAYPIRLSIACDGSGGDKVLSISTVAESEVSV